MNKRVLVLMVIALAIVVSVFWVTNYGSKPEPKQVQSVAQKATPAPAPKAQAPDTKATGTATPTPQTQTQPHQYTIVEGDELLLIAKAACDDASRYQEIADLNPKITAPDKIFAGGTLLIPSDCKTEFTPRRVHGHRQSQTAAPKTADLQAPPNERAPGTNMPGPNPTQTPTLAPQPAPASTPQPAATTVAPQPPAIPSTSEVGSQPTNAVIAETTTKSDEQHFTKKGGFYTVRFTAEQITKLYPAIQTGTFFTLELAHQQVKGKWEGAWKQRNRTRSVVTKEADGSTDITVWLKKMPTVTTTVTFLSGAEGVVLPSDVLLNLGAPARGSPQIGTDPEGKAHEKILCATFKKEPNAVVRSLVVVGIPVARTAVAYAMGGPALAILVNVQPVLNFTARKFTQSLVTSQQVSEPPTADRPSIEAQQQQ